MGVLLDDNFIELVQKMWSQHLRPELLDADKDLPDHIATSLGVNQSQRLYVMGLLYLR